MRALLAIFICTALASGCATRLEGDLYRGQEPGFDLFDFFGGEVRAWGLVQNRSGEVVQRFTVDIEGRVDGDRLVLDESFRYALGEGVQRRVWTIYRGADGRYRGGADDILGEAEGRSFGNAFRWRYAMDLPVGERTVRVGFDDWIWAMDDNTIINRSYIQKFGLDVAEVTLFMQRRH
jgi:hypothetical protein